METKQKLIEEAAFILEQEGWVAEMLAREIGNSRLRRFGERYRQWQNKVKEFRKENPTEWEEPPDNS